MHCSNRVHSLIDLIMTSLTLHDHMNAWFTLLFFKFSALCSVIVVNYKYLTTINISFFRSTIILSHFSKKNLFLSTSIFFFWVLGGVCTEVSGKGVADGCGVS